MKKRYLTYLVTGLLSALLLTGCSTDTVVETAMPNDEVVLMAEVKQENEEEVSARLDREKQIAKASLEAQNVKAISELELEDGYGKISIASTTRKNVAIPAYIYFPAHFDENNSYPLVIMFSAFGGDHDMGGKYSDIAKYLADSEKFVLLYDNPGYGASQEDNLQYTLSNVEQDAMDVLNYMRKTYDISSVGAFGYDVGGRVAMELEVDGRIEFDHIALVAPYCETDDFINACFGQENWEELRAEAKSNGWVTYGQQIYSAEWFTDWDKNSDNLTDDFIKKYKGNRCMVIYAMDDNQVPFQSVEKLADEVGSATLCITYGGHALALEGYDTPKEIVRIVTDQSVAFMQDLK